MQDIRLIGLDLDGTVFDDAKHISPRNLAAIEAAVDRALKDGLRTADTLSQGKTKLGCREMGKAICERI